MKVAVGTLGRLSATAWLLPGVALGVPGFLILLVVFLQVAAVGAMGSISTRALSRDKRRTWIPPGSAKQSRIQRYRLITGRDLLTIAQSSMHRQRDP